MLDTHAITQKITDELETVTAELKTIATYNEVADDWVAVPSEPQTGEADANLEADTTEDWNERRAILSNLETRYNNLKRALQKLTADTYGQCEICEGSIAPERLTANPAARTCSEHMDQEESLPLR